MTIKKRRTVSRTKIKPASHSLNKIIDIEIPARDRSHIYRRIITVLVILTVMAVCLAYGFYTKASYGQATKNSSTETQDIVNYLQGFMELPTNETPTMATVTDKTKLQDQSFFKNAENGDKVIAYVNAKKAILYRPSTKKVIDVGPIYIQNNGTTTGNTSTNK